jgi:hypothetical protein
MLGRTQLWENGKIDRIYLKIDFYVWLRLRLSVYNELFLTNLLSVNY